MKLQIRRFMPLGVSAVLAPAIVVAGCGGGSSSSASSSAPQAKESIRAYADRYASLVNSGSCAKIHEANQLFGASRPPSCATEAADLRNFKVTGAASFGTGGVIDFTDAANPASNSGTYVVAVTKSGQWSIIFNPAGIPSVGTTAPSAAPFTSTLTAFNHAVKTKNCIAVVKYALRQPGQSQSQFCQGVLNPENVAAASGKTMPLGGTKAFQFYALTTGTQYLTIAVGYSPSAHPPYIVLGAVPGR